MTDTLAYQIGAVFFLAVLFMAGTMTRDLFPKGILKTVRLSMYVVVGLLVGFVVYRRLPNISSVLNLTPWGSAPAPAQRAPAPAVAIKQSDAPRPAIKTRKVQTIHHAAPAVDAAPEPQAILSHAADPPSAVSQPQTDSSSPPTSSGKLPRLSKAGGPRQCRTLGIR